MIKDKDNFQNCHCHLALKTLHTNFYTNAVLRNQKDFNALKIKERMKDYKKLNNVQIF